MRRVLLGMSGGVDSSLSALLLREQGAEVVGIHFSNGPAGEAAQAAKRSAERIGMELILKDWSDRFSEIIDYFAEEYARGRTPNPCARCNPRVKFHSLIEEADRIGAEIIATGHYARIRTGPGGPELLRGTDESKDQSYFLHALSREVLSRVTFPLGEMTKRDVRERAAREGLEAADREDSQEICFAPDGNHHVILADRLGNRIRKGEIVTTGGRVVGQHPGIVHFTVGQRRGLGVAAERPLYVIRIEPEGNRVVIGGVEELERRELEVEEICWIGDRPAPREEFPAMVRVRYRHAGVPGRVVMTDANRGRILFDEPVRAVTPGQAAVFYDGDRVLGGGTIR